MLSFLLRTSWLMCIHYSTKRPHSDQDWFSSDWTRFGAIRYNYLFLLGQSGGGIRELFFGTIFSSFLFEAVFQDFWPLTTSEIDRDVDVLIKWTLFLYCFLPIDGPPLDLHGTPVVGPCLRVLHLLPWFNRFGGRTATSLMFLNTLLEIWSTFIMSSDTRTL